MNVYLKGSNPVCNVLVECNFGNSSASNALQENSSNYQQPEIPVLEGTTS